MAQRTIKRGTLVTLKTTNGGQKKGRLYSDWVASYAIYLDTMPMPVEPERILSVEEEAA